MINHDGIVCSNCGSDYTSSNWLRTCNKDGSWDGKYHCGRCHPYYNPNTGKFLRNEKINKHENTVCSNCGSNHTSGNWLKTYDKDGYWYEKYHCVICHRYYNPNTGKFSRNPKTYNIYKNRKCVKCGSNKISGSWRKIYDEDDNCDQKSYLCSRCYEIYNPNSGTNIKKSMAQFRNGDLDPNSTVGKGFRAVQCVAKVLGIEDCNIKLDNFQTGIDLYHEEYGKIEVRGSSFHLVGGYWKISDISYKNFDTLYIVCMDSNFENVIRVYRMHKEDAGIGSINIIRNSSSCDWYEKFRIDEKPYQEAFKSMSIENCKYLRKK